MVSQKTINAATTSIVELSIKEKVVTSSSLGGLIKSLELLASPSTWLADIDVEVFHPVINLH